MIFLELLTRSLCALGLFGFSLGTAYSIACRGFPHPCQTRLRLCVTGITWGWLAITVFFVLAAFGLFSPVPGLGAAGALFFLTRRFPPPHANTSALVCHDRRLITATLAYLARLPEGWLYLLGFGTFIVHVFRGLLTPPLAWDSLTYHHVFAATWVQQAGLFPFRTAPDFWNFSYAFFPANGEIFSAWALMPFHSDLLLSLAHIPCWFLNLLAVVGLGRALGLPSRSALFAALVAGFTPSQFAYLVSGYVEIALCAFLTAGAWLSLHAWRTPALPSLLAAVAAFGIALGIKLPAMVPIACLLPLLLIALSRLRDRSMLHTGVLLLAVFLPVATPWYLRNQIVTGSFSYPIKIQVFGKTLADGSPELERFLSLEFRDWKSRHPSFTPSLWSEVEVFKPSPNAAGPALLLAALLTPFGIRRLWRSPQRSFLFLQICSTIALFAGYWSPPMQEIRPIHAESLCRILHPGFQFLLIAAFAVIRPLSGTRFLVLPFATIYLFNVAYWLPSSWEGGSPELAPVLHLLPFLGLFLLPWFLKLTRTRLPLRSPFPHGRIIALAVLGSLLLLPLDILRSDLRNWFLENGYDVHPLPRRAAPLWVRADQPAPATDHRSSGGLRPLRIAYSVGWRDSNREWFWYPLFGSRLQNTVEYVPITEDGSLHHFSVQSDPGPRAALNAWLGRLIERRITSVILGPPLPIESAWTQRFPEAFPVWFQGPDMVMLGFDPTKLPATILDILRTQAAPHP